jgi:hypothetical protein
MKMRGARHVARIGEKRNVYRLLVGKLSEERLLGRPRRRWINSVMRDILDIGLGGVVWVSLAQDRDKWRALLNAVMNLRVP